MALLSRLKLSLGVTGYTMGLVMLAVNTRNRKLQAVKTEVPGSSHSPQSFGDYKLFSLF